VSPAHANGDKPPPVFDLEAAAAAEVEAAPFAFAYKGKPYELPSMAGWPLTTVRAVGRGDLEGALAELIGPETYDQLCDDGLTVGELTALFRGAGATQAGLSLPNSRRPARPASTRTSKRR
jgi:hypothetical protein